MKRFVLLAIVAASTVSALAADVRVSVAVGQPTYYGRIDVGSVPPPQVIYVQPVVIEPLPADGVRQPIHLRVPAKHAKNWRKHCRQYDACGQPVYFVSESWYSDVYVKGHGKGKDKKQKKD